MLFSGSRFGCCWCFLRWSLPMIAPTAELARLRPEILTAPQAWPPWLPPLRSLIQWLVGLKAREAVAQVEVWTPIMEVDPLRSTTTTMATEEMMSGLNLNLMTTTKPERKVRTPALAAT